MIFKITVSAIRPQIGARYSTWRAYVLEPTREKCAHEVAIDAAHWEGLKNPKVVAIGPAQVGDGIPAILAACDLKAFAISNASLSDIHKGLAQKGTASWIMHVETVVLPLLRREFHDFRFAIVDSPLTIRQAGISLKHYFTKHFKGNRNALCYSMTDRNPIS
jgi:hypothetical protein